MRAVAATCSLCGRVSIVSRCPGCHFAVTRLTDALEDLETALLETRECEDLAEAKELLRLVRRRIERATAGRTGR